MTLPKVAFTFFDFDTEGANGDGAEYMTAAGYSSAHLTPQSEVLEEPVDGGSAHTFRGTTVGDFADNPQHPWSLTQQERNRAVSLLYADMHSVQVTVGTSSTGADSFRVIQFVGWPTLLCRPEETLGITTNTTTTTEFNATGNATLGEAREGGWWHPWMTWVLCLWVALCCLVPLVCWLLNGNKGRKTRGTKPAATKDFKLQDATRGLQLQAAASPAPKVTTYPGVILPSHTFRYLPAPPAVLWMYSPPASASSLPQSRLVLSPRAEATPPTTVQSLPPVGTVPTVWQNWAAPVVSLFPSGTPAFSYQAVPQHA
jgi:hypothetical protein